MNCDADVKRLANNDLTRLIRIGVRTAECWKEIAERNARVRAGLAIIDDLKANRRRALQQGEPT